MHMSHVCSTHTTYVLHMCYCILYTPPGAHRYSKLLTIYNNNKKNNKIIILNNKKKVEM